MNIKSGLLPCLLSLSLEPRSEAYFRTQLDQLRQADPARPLVFYYRADCWMSWNSRTAAKTARCG